MWLPLEGYEVPTQEDYEFRDDHDYYNNPDKWEQHPTGKKKRNADGEEVDVMEWRIKDEKARSDYKKISKLIKDYEGQENFRETRIPPWQYNARINEIWNKGLGTIWLRPQQTGALHSLRVGFPDGFQHLINEAAVNKKEQDPASFHISLAYNDRLHGDLKTELEKFYEDYFELRDPANPSNGYWWKEVTFNKPGGNTVSSGSTYQFEDLDDPFVKAMHEIQLKGSKDGESLAHISLD
jgi:hypothetical protein